MNSAKADNSERISLLSSSDCDQDQQTPARGRDLAPTIGEVLNSEIETLSDGEFEMSYLERYPHRHELTQCCEQALEDLADEPYLGRVSNAQVMGRAMELLRRQHQVNAPRGWLPVMRMLRQNPNLDIGKEQPGSSFSEPPTDMHTGGFLGAAYWKMRSEEWTREAEEHFRKRFSDPNNVLEPGSAVHDPDSKLAEEVRKDARLRDLFVKLAKRLGGPPQTWQEGVPFMEAVVAEMTAAGMEIPPTVLQMQQNVVAKWTRQQEKEAALKQERMDSSVESK